MTSGFRAEGLESLQASLTGPCCLKKRSGDCRDRRGFYQDLRGKFPGRAKQSQPGITRLDGVQVFRKIRESRYWAGT